MSPPCELRQGLMLFTTEGGHRQRADLDFVVRIQSSAFDGGIGQLIQVKQVRCTYAWEHMVRHCHGQARASEVSGRGF